MGIVYFMELGPWFDGAVTDNVIFIFTLNSDI